MFKDRDLLEAAQKGQITTVEKLLRNKPKTNKFLSGLRRLSGLSVEDSSGYSALHYAALNGHREVASLLLARQIGAFSIDSQGSTPIHLAAWAGHSEIVELLIQSSADGAVNIKNNHGETALHCAAQYGHTRVVAALLSSGADAAVENTKFQTPLELAALYGRLETVKMLIKTHPELIEIYGGPGRFPSSPLHSASRNGHSEIVEALLDAGFPVSMATPAGTALHEAAAGGKLVIVRLLLARGVDARRRDARGHTAQHVLEDLATPLARDITTLIRDRISSQSCEIPEN